MWRTLTTCNEPGCGLAAVPGTRWCEKHQVDNHEKKYDRDRNANDRIRKMYKLARWIHLSEWLRRRNAQCQRLRAGVQCWHPSTLVHHLISPYDRLDLFFTPGNLVCLCADCHPGGTAGTPSWKEGVDFVATKHDIFVGNSSEVPSGTPF